MNTIPGSAMKSLKTVTVVEFEERCKTLLELVRRTRQPLLITHKGKPVAQISPYSSGKPRGKKTKRRESLNPLKGNVLHEGDLISPIDDTCDWMP